MADETASAMIEKIVLDSYGKLIAFLASRNGNDISAAEDALADAFVRALSNWSSESMPIHPQAWLLRVAQNRILDGFRHSEVQRRLKPHLEECQIVTDGLPDESIPDERLQLLFACAHPAIDHSVRTPLVLQSVLGVAVDRIASAFLVSSQAMSQRLVRAKRKIRDAGIRLEIPSKHELLPRLQTVHEAIYTAFSTNDSGDQGFDRGLSIESIKLVELLVDLLPEQPETMGLLSLLLYIDARRAARRDSDGNYVPLADQDHRLWDTKTVVRAESLLAESASFRRIGRFQLEAAIQSAHMQRLFGRQTPWREILGLYEALAATTPAIGVRVSQAAALHQANRARAALETLDRLDPLMVRCYQPYWAVRAFVLASLGNGDASQCFMKAIGLCTDSPTRDYLKKEFARYQSH